MAFSEAVNCLHKLIINLELRPFIIEQVQLCLEHLTFEFSSSFVDSRTPVALAISGVRDL